MNPTPEDDVLAERLVLALQPFLRLRPESRNLVGVHAASQRVETILVGLGFAVRRFELGRHPVVLVADRPGRGSLRIGLAGHYDIEEAGCGWSTEPFTVTRAAGRLFARGIADNLGPLLLRLMALEGLHGAPSLLFVLQGEEEVGSPAAHRIYPQLNLPRVDFWLEETGYYEADGSQRLLARGIERLPEVVRDALMRSAREHGRQVVVHDRFLNKAFGQQRCPFLTHLIGPAPYLAIGPNDSSSRIHRTDESLAIANLAASVHQFRSILIAAGGG